MNALISLLPLLAGVGLGAAPAPVEETDVVKDCRAETLKIMICDGGENAPDFKWEDGEKNSPAKRPAPRPRETVSADANYAEMKKRLDENFKVMFQLKKELDAAQSKMSAKWEEYYALQNAYNKELKKIVASWVTETLY